MFRHFIWTFILFGCDLNPGTENYHTTSSLSETATIFTPYQEHDKLTTSSTFFDNQQPFEIVSVTNSIIRNTTDTDTIKCSRWTLSKMQIEEKIKNSKPIDGTIWDLSFSVLACTKSVSVIQSRQQFSIEINAASFFSVYNGDTTVLFGDYNKAHRQYFLDGPNSK